MGRLARGDIVTEEGGYFHVLNRVAGDRNYFPFRIPFVRRYFMRWFRRCLARTHMRAAAFTLMDNHYHLILLVERFRRLAREELEHFAQLRWGHLWKVKTCRWSDTQWDQFNRDLFSLSVFMRDLQGPFASWFNRFSDRRGHLWAERYKAVKLEDLSAVQECLFYIELNPVRAKLASLPEQWKYGSAYLRWIGRDEDFMPLEELFPDLSPKRLREHYQSLLLYRGISSLIKKQHSIPPQIVQTEQARGFTRPGLYLKRLRFLSDGLILGGLDVICDHLTRLRQAGRYKRRQNPTAQLGGLFYTVREQRSHNRF